MTTGLVERIVHGLVLATEHALGAEATARVPGLLQSLDPRVKLLGVFALVAAAVAARTVAVVAAIFALSVALALLSRVPMRTLAARVWIPVLFFSGAIALPAIVLVPGRVVAHIPGVDWPVTAQGLRSAVLVVSRAETAASLSLLLVLCTPWMHVLKALRVLGVPVPLVVILGMTHRYAFLLLQTAREMFESRRSRLVGSLRGVERRRLATASAGVLLGKSLQLADDVHLAMQSRGYRGEVQLLDDFRMRRRDWASLAGLLAIAGLAMSVGR